MKKFICVLLIVLLAASAVLAASAETVKLAYRSGSINLRTGPGTQYKKIGYVTDGSKITVLSKGSIWSKVKTANGKEGYIKNLYISGIGKAYADGTKYYSTFYAGKVKTNTDSNVNLRAGAGSSEAKIMTLKKGINVTVLGKNGDWYLIATADGTQGFISTSLVTTSASGSSSGSGGSGSSSKDTAKVSGTRVYMRSGPSTSYAPITLLKQGTTVKVVSTANPKWWKISYGSLTGYMWSQYLKRQ